jgi:hypothetical protein
LPSWGDSLFHHLRIKLYIWKCKQLKARYKWINLLIKSPTCDLFNKNNATPWIWQPIQAIYEFWRWMKVPQRSEWITAIVQKLSYTATIFKKKIQMELISSFHNWSKIGIENFLLLWKHNNVTWYIQPTYAKVFHMENWWSKFNSQVSFSTTYKRVPGH